MILEARSPSCFSNHYVVNLDGRPHGEFRGRWFSEGVDIRLTSRRLIHFERLSWGASSFTLSDASDSEVLAEASRGGIFTSAWKLTLSIGAAELVSAGMFNTGFHVLQGSTQAAQADRIGACEGGWFVKDDGSLQETDLLFIGLIYHTILRRRSSAAAAAAS